MNPNARRNFALLIALVAPLVVLLALPPIAQSAEYHALVDTRLICGVRNFMNVASNVAFLAVGGVGLAFCLTRAPQGAQLSWTVFFAAVALVAFGSAYYHTDPRDSTLLWDRLPMTIAFMALLSALLSEHLETSRERAWLIAAIAAGIGSLVWWRVAGDLRLYGWVQLAPFLAIAVLLAAFPGRYKHRQWLGWGLVFYALAKAAETGDAAIYEMTARTISGHTVKHLLAACAPLCVYIMLRKRVTQREHA